MTIRRCFYSLALAFTAFTTAPCPADEPVLPPPYFSEPVMVQLQNEDFNNETIDKIYDMGFRGFRRGIYWQQVDKKNGEYDFSAWDEQFKHANSKGMRIIGCLFGNNHKYENDPGIGGIQTEAGRKGFAKFAAAAAERYKDYGIIWEIWTEPNVRTFWRKNKEQVGDLPPAKHNSETFAEEYTLLVKEITKEMLKADPDAFIVAGSVSNFWKPSYEWTEFCFKRGILDTGIKGWSVHPYGVKLPEDTVEGYEITRKLLAQYGKPDLPVLNTERGYSLGKHAGGGEVASEGFSGGPEEMALTFQSWHTIRQLMIDQMQDVRATSLYQLSGHKRTIGADKFMIDGRPVGTAIEVMCKQLDGYKYVKRLPAERERDYVLLWENKDGGQKLVAWTAPPAKGTPEQVQDHEVTISGLTGDVPMVDLMGKASTASGKFPLSGAVIYLDVPKGATPGEAKVVPGTLKDLASGGS